MGKENRLRGNIMSRPLDPEKYKLFIERCRKASQQRSAELAKLCSERFKGTTKSEEHKKKISESNIKAYRDGKRNVNGINNPMFGRKRPDNIERNKRLISEGRMGFNTETLQKAFMSNSKRKELRKTTELPVKNILEELGYIYAGYYEPGKRYEEHEFCHDYRTPGLTITAFFDFAFPTYKKAIETDGEYWHETKKERDRFRDAHFSNPNLGWKILRLSDAEIKNKERIKQEIKEFMNN
jgi:hypothetical protein